MKEIDPDELDEHIAELRSPQPAYDRGDELLRAGEFVADFGTFAQLFDGENLTNAWQWNYSPTAAWAMLAHWSQMRGDPTPDPDDPFAHADDCDSCSYLEDVAILRDTFEHEDCSDCGLDLDHHDVAPDQFNRAHAYCRQVWTRAEPFVACAGTPTRDGTASDAYSARWYARLNDGNWALINRNYYLIEETDADSRRPDVDSLVVEVEDEYIVCSDLNDPGSSEINSTAHYSYLEDPESLDPQKLALDAPEPEAGEWQEFAPDNWKNELAPVMEGVTR